jgi:hypothetical protein
MKVRKPSSIARQGTDDGLCGIYCLMNAVRRLDVPDGLDEESLLQYFLEAAHKLTMLLPQKICYGYEAHEIVSIFNEFAVTHDYPAKATLLRSKLWWEQLTTNIGSLRIPTILRTSGF